MNESDPQIDRASVLSDLGRHEEALALLTRILATDPRNARALTDAGFEFYWLKRYDEAADVASRAVEEDPRGVRAFNLLALTRDRQGRYAEAEPPARRAAALDKDSATTVAILAKVVARFPERADEALELFAEAARLDPEDPNPHFQRGYLLVGMRRWALAEEALLQCLARDPQRATAQGMLGIVRVSLGEYAAARDDLVAALRELHARDIVASIVQVIEGQGVPDELKDVYARCLTMLNRPLPGGIRTRMRRLMRRAMLDAARKEGIAERSSSS